MSIEAESQLNRLAVCNQVDCNEPAAYLVTWPGKDQAGICAKHGPIARGIANAMGFHLQLIPIAAGTP